jgi:hypothetical protein
VTMFRHDGPVKREGISPSPRRNLATGKSLWRSRRIGEGSTAS